MKRAREVIASTPGLAEILATDPRKAAMFYARSGVTEEWVGRGVPTAILPSDDQSLGLNVELSTAETVALSGLKAGSR